VLTIAIVLAVIVAAVMYALCVASGRESRLEEQRFQLWSTNQDGTFRPTVIAVDFDGCLFTDAWPDVGRPNWDLITSLIEFRAHGGKVILWTCREGERLDEALRECALCGLEFDAVNENLESWVARYGNESRKVGADYYIDDRAVRVVAAQEVRP
jgi:hypothetical protein